MKLRIVPAGTGLQWVKLGIQTFFRQPLALSGLFFMFMAAVSVLSIIPILGTALSAVLTPAANLGLMAASREASAGRFPMPSTLVSAFRGNREQKRAMLVLGSISMFVPVLGEVMMTVMACQLLAESIEGVVEWSDGDRQAAKAHLLDVAQNLLLLGLTAGAGKGLSRLSAVESTPVIEDLHPVTLPDGSARLCRSDMAGYEVPGAFDPDTGPDAMGRYTLDDRSFIRLGGKVYEQVFDRDLKRWRIRHPTDAQAYQPVLAHNAAGAWRHVLENPLSWSRLRLLRRMGHIADACSDEQLLTIADIAGVSDNALRRMHMDSRLPPPELADALRLARRTTFAPKLAEALAQMEAALRAGWQRLHASVSHHRPELVLDGALVEGMGARGLELVVGAKRDADWGPVVLVGLGGIWIEALKDVRLIPADMAEEDIAIELTRLKAAVVLQGIRGAAAVDLQAIARVVAQVGAQMRANPNITEIDINPLVAYPLGSAVPVLALDALVVAKTVLQMQ